jgi:hypothetical protein
MVRTIAPPTGVAELAALDRVDYQEAFAFAAEAGVAETRGAAGGAGGGTAAGSVRSPEEWARRILEGAPPRKRAAMLLVWTALGIRLAPLGSPGQVLGWRIRYNGPDAIVLGVRAAAGLTARVVIQADAERVVHAMLVRYDRAIARRVWTVLGPRHHRFVADLLDRASRA